MLIASAITLPKEVEFALVVTFGMRNSGRGDVDTAQTYTTV